MTTRTAAPAAMCALSCVEMLHVVLRISARHRADCRPAAVALLYAPVFIHSWSLSKCLHGSRSDGSQGVRESVGRMAATRRMLALPPQRPRLRLRVLWPATLTLR